MNKEKRKFDRGQVFIKIMAGILAIMMLIAATATLIFALI